MLVLDLIRQEWKKNYRAIGFYKNLAVNILLGFFALYMAAVLLFVGFSLNELLEKADSKLNPMQLFNGAMLYLMLLGLTLRFLMQQLNTFNLPPYQVLPVKRSFLINFLILKPLASPLNYFLLLIVVPFSLKSVVGYYSGFIAAKFVISFVLMVWFNSLAGSFFKRKYGSGLLTFLGVLSVLFAIAALEYFKILSLFKFSMSLYGIIILKTYGMLLPLAFVAIAYLLNRWFFAQNYYPENFNSKIKGDMTVTRELTFLNRFGVIGEVISLELKLILRHKRTRSILIMSVFFLFYGLLFYTNKTYANSSFLFFVAMFMTGVLMLMFGQWIISWDSSHFDSMMTKNIPIRTYLNANYYLLIAFNIICFVLTTPYFFFGKNIIYLHLTAFLFNMGVNVYLLLFFATYNTRKIDLSKSSAMNYQGTTYKNFLIILPLMFVPIIILSLLTYIISQAAALWTLALLGLAGILFQKQLITLCVNQFNKRKYKMAEGFRQGE